MGKASLLSDIHGNCCLNVNFSNVNGEATLDEYSLNQAFKALERSDEANIIILHGNDKDFCNGLDINFLVKQEKWPTSANSLLNNFSDLLITIDKKPQLVIAMVKGAAMGGGLGIAAVADFVLASPSAVFALPETMVGLIPAVVFPYVMRRTGLMKAKLLALGIQIFDAQRAYDCGLADEVAEDEQARLRYLVKRFGRMDSEATKSMKRLIRRHFPLPENYLDYAKDAFQALYNSESTRKRLSLFCQGYSPWMNDGDE
ncbi:hypothetical protein TUM19329_30250 [Legionella antarctica]|uniref:Enoyl-CoA hydratase n=1 Tax=Legionella antarctica TaxID=2708020 RepID=A0A6F8T7K2_9GAMM|nr:enoyl-CoA hydratase/isomerase family protein [Legionella antarctica]BCA96664.1 hypothetical protein TUM19329_30250 [Legionella antarctica]